VTSHPEEFRTARLTAERLTGAHVADLLAMHADPRHMEFLGGVRDEAQTREYLERNLAHWAAHGYGVWILRDAASRRVAGRAIVRHLLLDDLDEVEVGYGFQPEYWGRGLATEIATACVGYAFDVLHLPSVVGLTVPHNTRSRRVLEKVGMAYERDVLLGEAPHVLYRVFAGR